MPIRPRLIRSIPFWALVVASVGTALGGAALLVEKLGVMTTTLTDGTATGVEVYVGQSLAGLGAILLGVGVIGILITLAIAAISTLRPHSPVEVVEPIDWSSEPDADADADTQTAAPVAEPDSDAERPAEFSTTR